MRCPVAQPYLKLTARTPYILIADKSAGTDGVTCESIYAALMLPAAVRLLLAAQEAAAGLAALARKVISSKMYSCAMEMSSGSSRLTADGKQVNGSRPRSGP